MISIFSTEENRGVGKNLAFATASQGVTLLSSVVMSLIVPRVLNVEEYAYWQLFLLYSSYTGITLLGVNDGIYLRIGGKKYDDLDYGRLKAQFVVVGAAQLLVGLTCLIAANAIEIDASRRFVLLAVVTCGLAANLTVCVKYVFQCTNLTQVSSFADMIPKACFLVCVVAALIDGASTSWLLIFFYTAFQVLSLVYVLICARRILAARATWSQVLRDCAGDAIVGIKIAISYYADSFIVGFTRIIVDWRLGLATFGKISFVFSLTNFVLGFIGQVSMVLFPVLKRLGEGEQREKYQQIRAALNILLPVAYLFYVPMKLALSWWLPQYEDSLLYLALTMPLAIYACKANFLFDTYLKIRRRESVLGAANVLTMALSSMFSAIAVFGFASVEWAGIGVVISVVMRDFFFERYEGRAQEVPYLRSCLFLLALSAGFMAASWMLGVWSWFAVAGMLATYMLLNRNDTIRVFSIVKRKLSR